MANSHLVYTYALTDIFSDTAYFQGDFKNGCLRTPFLFIDFIELLIYCYGCMAIFFETHSYN